MAEKRKPIWLESISPTATSGVNKETGQTIDGRYFNLYDRTRAFAAIPIEHGSQFSILTVETPVVDSLNRFHIDLMWGLAESNGNPDLEVRCDGGNQEPHARYDTGISSCGR